MNKNLSAISDVIRSIFKKTDELEKLSEKVNEIICDELIKDCSLQRVHKEHNDKYYIYEVKKDDFEHILNHIEIIQKIIAPQLVIMLQTDDVNNYKVFFRKA